MGESPKVTVCRALLLGLAFFTTGLCISIIGPTLPDIQSQTDQKSIRTTIIVVCTNAFGTIVGLIFGSFCFKLINSYLTIATLLICCSMITITIPYCRTISWVSLAFLLQGITLGLIFKGAISQFYTYWKQRYQILIAFYFIFALGATVSPLITSSYVHSKSENITITISNYTDVEFSPTTTTKHVVPKRAAIESTTSPNPNTTTSSMTTYGSSFDSTSFSSTITVTPKMISRSANISETKSTITPNLSLILNESEHFSTNATAANIKNQTFLETIFYMNNNVKMAYVFVSIITFLSALSYSFICCCTSCRWLRTPPIQSSDYPFKFKQVWSSRTNFYAISSSTAFALLVGAFEATVTNLLTIYCTDAMDKPQRSGVLLTSVFWFTVAMSRFTVLFFQKKVFEFIPLATAVGVAALSCSFMITFSKSWMVLWFSIAVLGFTTGHLGPVGFCWLDQRLALGPWYASVWLGAVQFGRMTVPHFTAYVMNGKTIMFPIVLVILIVLLGLTTFGFKKTVSVASQLTVVDKLVLTNNGEAFAYTKPVDDDDGFELDQLDEYTYFDRQKTVSYFVKQAPAATTFLK